MKKTISTLLMLLVLMPLAWSDDGPRTGYFRTSITPLELLGEAGANAITSVFAPDEKMLRAILAQAVLERDYRIDTDRYYLFGYSGGALPWGSKELPKIELVRQNRYMFMCGSKDKDRRKMQQSAAAYKAAGVVNTKVVTVANVNRQMPGSS